MSVVPPFDEAGARAKVKKAQDLWNTKSIFFTPGHRELTMCRDPAWVTNAYTEDSIWRNRDVFLAGHAEIEAFLTKMWQKEVNYRLRKELFAFGPDRIAVQFWYEYQDSSDGLNWKRCYGLEDWTFAADGRMRKRQMSGNDILISEDQRWFRDGVDINSVEISERHW